MKTGFDRRTFMQRAALAGAALLTAGPMATRAKADPDPPAGTAGAAGSAAEPEVFTFPFGGTDAFVVLDGVFTLPSIQPAFVPEAKPKEVEDLMQKSFLSADHLSLSLNVLVLKTKSGVLLFDAGGGGAFGPGCGKLLRGLKRIGVAPADVKSIFVTHAHSDHINGLVDSDNHPVFEQARVLAAKSEVDFWLSDSPNLSGMRTPPETTAQVAVGIKKVLTGAKPNLDLKEQGKLSPEVELLAAPGHTPGHSLFRVTQGNDKLLVFGDAVHVHALQFPHPEWTMAYDVDPALAVKTRRKLFEEAAAERIMLMGYHMPFPGIGHVRAAGKGFEWVPRPWVA